MKFLVFLVQLLIIFSAFISTVDHNNDLIEEVGDQDINQVVYYQQFVIVYVYSDQQCQICGEIESFLLESAKFLKNSEINNLFVKLNANKNSKARLSYQIFSVPKIVLFIDRIPINYEGELNTDSFVDWIIEQHENYQKRELENAESQIQKYNQDDTDYNILPLTELNFFQQINKKNYTVIFFYKTNYEEIQSNTTVISELQKAAYVLKEMIMFRNFNLNSEIQQIKREDYGLKIYYEGIGIEYENDEITQQSIVNWIQKIVGFSLFQIRTKQQFQNFIKFNKIGIIYFRKALRKQEEILIKKFSLIYEGVGFAIMENEEISKQENINNSSLILYNQITKNKVEFNGSLFGSNFFQNFIEQNQYPNLIELDSNIMEIIEQSNFPAIFLFLYNTADFKLFRTIKNEFELASIELRNKILFLISYDQQIFNQFIDFKIQNIEDPIIFIKDQKDIYKFQDQINQINIVHFFKEWLQSKLFQYQPEEQEHFDQEENYIQEDL